jgi:hypothetical protein
MGLKTMKRASKLDELNGWTLKAKSIHDIKKELDLVGGNSLDYTDIENVVLAMYNLGYTKIEELKTKRCDYCNTEYTSGIRGCCKKGRDTDIEALR